LTEFIVSDEAEVLPTVERLDWREADVLRESEYAYSVRLDDSGLWCIFQRGGDRVEAEIIPLLH
jgi:hypothetical protein